MRGTWSFLPRSVGIIALGARAGSVCGERAHGVGRIFKCRWCAANPLSELCRGNVLAAVDPPSRSASARESGMWDAGPQPSRGAAARDVGLATAPRQGSIAAIADCCPAGRSAGREGTRRVCDGAVPGCSCG